MSNFTKLSEAGRARFIKAWLIAGRKFDEIDEALVNAGDRPIECGEFSLARDSAALVA